MTVHLEDTNAGAVALGIAAERFAQGSSAVGRVLTLVIVADEDMQSDAMRAAVRAAREHPCRILVAIPRHGRGAPRLDASITVGGYDGLGEVVELRLRGPLARHTESVVLPLLVPDAPVVVWWPGAAPAIPAEDPVGALGQRRITDTATATRPLAALERCRTGHQDGDTDLAWTRLTPWRALLAAMLDQPYDKITGGSVHVARSNPSGLLLAAWLQHCLQVPIGVVRSRGPGITSVVLQTQGGELEITRPDGQVALVRRPGFPDREAALPRRTTEELIAEELRRLDPDEILSETLAELASLDSPRARTAGKATKTAARKSTTTKPRTTAQASAAKKRQAATKPAAAKKPARKATAASRTPRGSARTTPKSRTRRGGTS